MARTLDEMDRELTQLRSEVEALKRQKSALDHPLRKLAGTLQSDEELKRIIDGIEAKRQVPDQATPEGE